MPDDALFMELYINLSVCVMVTGRHSLVFIVRANHETSTKEPGWFGRLGGAGGTPPPPIPGVANCL